MVFILAIGADVTNVAEVTANPTDSFGNDLPDVPDATGTDDAEVDVVVIGLPATRTAPRSASRSASPWPARSPRRRLSPAMPAWSQSLSIR